MTKHLDDKQLAKLSTRLRKDKLSIQELQAELGISKSKLLNGIANLRAQGVVIAHEDNRYNVKLTPDIGNVFDLGGHDGKYHEWKFCLMSDTHIASTFHLPKSLRESLDKLVDRGIKHVFHSGDVVDGMGIYKGHHENLVTSSIERQTDMAAETFMPYNRRLRFWSIAGNHDYSFTQMNGAKPLALIEAKTPNFVNLGDLRADVKINDLRIRLLHGAGGRSYALSYPSQTYLRDYFKGLEREQLPDIPHIMGVGHFHTVYHAKDHGIWVFQPGSFQDGDNEYCVRRGLTGPAGLWEVTVKHTGKEIHELSANYIQPEAAKKEKGSAFAKTTVRYAR